MSDTKTTETKAAPKAKVHARYVGNGKQFFIGVPAKDLDKSEFDALTLAQQRDVLASSIYEVDGAKKDESK